MCETAALEQAATQNKYARTSIQPQLPIITPWLHCNTMCHAATCCNALHRAATRCNTLQHATTRCNTLQHAATRYSTLQHAATRCNTLQHIPLASESQDPRNHSILAESWFVTIFSCTLQPEKNSFLYLQHTATHCITPLQQLIFNTPTVKVHPVERWSMTNFAFACQLGIHLILCQIRTGLCQIHPIV